VGILFPIDHNIGCRFKGTLGAVASLDGEKPDNSISNEEFYFYRLYEVNKFFKEFIDSAVIKVKIVP